MKDLFTVWLIWPGLDRIASRTKQKAPTRVITAAPTAVSTTISVALFLPIGAKICFPQLNWLAHFHNGWFILFILFLFSFNSITFPFKNRYDTDSLVSNGAIRTRWSTDGSVGNKNTEAGTRLSKVVFVSMNVLNLCITKSFPCVSQRSNQIGQQQN